MFIQPNWCKNGFKNINAKFKVVFHRNDGTSTDDELVASNLSLIKDEEKKSILYRRNIK
ncbi:hypothetical protein UUR9_0688 [Ureaplasma urealyticum serovar 9 str. ATCC 33175]|nr:hypothetical protein [Ureaplasma urealyticum]EDX53650.1 hypothetical protein UUR9_0688 [Ureaplasma urealyticum serovar 9 str. ATCC 33175]